MARPDETLVAALLEVFRTHGYEGASLAILAEATGLARASLYHRFPGGKAEMAEVVMQAVRDWLWAHALAPLRDTTLLPAARIAAMCDHLDAFYHAGGKACLLEALSIGEVTAPVRRLAREALELWTHELATAVSAAGIAKREARRRAEQAITQVQGALVLARVQEDRAPFRRAIRALPELLLA